MAWAMDWAKISALFGACRILVKSITMATTSSHSNNSTRKNPTVSDRDDTEDAWNSIGASALTGAILAVLGDNWKTTQTKRQLQPIIHSSRLFAARAVATMTRGALLYGGTMFVLHPQVWKEGLQTLMLTPSSFSSSSTTTDSQDWGMLLWDSIGSIE
jgi:hypothetical protein